MGSGRRGSGGRRSGGLSDGCRTVFSALWAGEGLAGGKRRGGKVDRRIRSGGGGDKGFKLNLFYRD